METMTDIVERLRQGVDPNDIPETEASMDRGADEIERLTNEAVLSSEVPWVADPWHYSSWDGHQFNDSERACGRCQFWEHIAESYANGLCRRHAPRATSPFDETITEAAITQAQLTYPQQPDALRETTEEPRRAFWPTTVNFDWCGEFKLRSNKPGSMPR
jgi:hypothetical protein